MSRVVKVAHTGSLQEAARETLRSLLHPDRYSRGIAIDLDETLAGVHRVMLRLYNEHKGASFLLKDHTDWDFRALGSNYGEMMQFYVRSWKYHPQEIALLGDRKLLVELAQYRPLEISSSRDREGPTGRTETEASSWIVAQRLAFMPYFFDDTKIKKIMLNYDICVDDSPRLAEDAVKVGGCFVLLVRKPYNEYIRGSGWVLPVANVDEAVSELIDACKKVGRQKKLYQSPEGLEFLNTGNGEIPKWVTTETVLRDFKILDLQAINVGAYSSKRRGILKCLIAGPASFGELASATSFSEPILSKLLDDLETLRYIRRHASRYEICDDDIAAAIKNRLKFIKTP